MLVIKERTRLIVRSGIRTYSWSNSGCSGCIIDGQGDDSRDENCESWDETFGELHDGFLVKCRMVIGSIVQ